MFWSVQTAAIAAYSVLFLKGGTSMKQSAQPLIIHCLFSGEGKELPEIIVECFLAFLRRSI